MQKASYKGEKNAFALRLKNLMDDTTTQQQLADVLNITRQTVSLYLNGSSLPPIEKLVEIANYFNVSTDYLLGLSDVKTPQIDIRAICEYTGLSESAINILRTEKIKLKTYETKAAQLDKLFDERISPIKERENILTQEEYTTLFLDEFEKFLKTEGDSFEIRAQASDSEDIFTFLERLINSALLKDFSVISNEAVFYQARELKNARYNDFLKTGYCKFPNELEEFERIGKNNKPEVNYDDDETDLCIYRGIKKYTRLIEDIANLIAENGELIGSFGYDEEGNKNADD